MMPTRYQRISQIIKDFAAGKLQRDSYWAEMQRFHLGLIDYRDQIKDSELERIEINSRELQVVLKNGLKFVWYPEDIRAAPSMLVNHGSYELIELAVIEHFTQFCQVAFDIGANIGWYTLHMARQLKGVGGRVYAFEPVPRTFTELQRNIELNHFDDVINSLNLALGEVAGTVEFFVPNFSGSVAASQRQLFPQEVNESVNCKMVTLDEFVRNQKLNRLDLIKCDVEGSELHVLRGGIQTIQAYQPIIMLEMLRKWSEKFGYHPNAIISFMKSRGYRCWFVEHGCMQELVHMEENCTQTNFFFLHNVKHEVILAHWLSNISSSS